MIKIIKIGKRPEEKEYTPICRNCGTHFSFLAKDAVEKEDRQWRYLSINCPLCNYIINVSV